MIDKENNYDKSSVEQEKRHDIVKGKPSWMREVLYFN